MRPVLVVGSDPVVEIGLQLGDRAIDFLPESDAVELVQYGLVEPLDDAVGLRVLGLGARVIDVLDRKVEPYSCRSGLPQYSLPRSVNTRMSFTS